MRFWWVNQNQTYRHEIQGGYLWSPKKMQMERVTLFMNRYMSHINGFLSQLH